MQADVNSRPLPAQSKRINLGFLAHQPWWLVMRYFGGMTGWKMLWPIACQSEWRIDCLQIELSCNMATPALPAGCIIKP